jgi:hypothetical protein
MTHEPTSRSHGRLWKSTFRSALSPTKCGLAIFSIAALAGGCNPSKDVAVQNLVSEQAAPQPNSPVVATGSSGFRNSPLVGAWMGKAIINEEALLEAADSLPTDQRQALIQEARTFVTTEMAIQFSQSGEIETAIEMQPVGSQRVTGESFGTWKIIEATDGKVTVETSSTDETGTLQTNQTAFAVSVDGNRLVLQPQVSSALANCEALIYLDRQAMPAASVAQAPEGTTFR